MWATGLLSIYTVNFAPVKQSLNVSVIAHFKAKSSSLKELWLASFLSVGCRLLLAYAITCSQPFCTCSRTAPRPWLLASMQTTNGKEKSAQALRQTLTFQMMLDTQGTTGPLKSLICDQLGCQSTRSFRGHEKSLVAGKARKGSDLSYCGGSGPVQNS